MTARAFTLVEILISISIFIVIGLVMMTALFTATTVFRDGEAARQAGDETTAVVTALQEDLDRMVPIKLRNGAPAPEWGQIKATLQPDGNCSLTFTAYNPDRAAILPNGVGSRIQVTWMVVPDGGDHALDALVRTTVTVGGTQSTTATMTTGCLHFGVWFDLPEIHRQVLPNAVASTSPIIDWESACRPSTAAPVLDTLASTPNGTGAFFPRPNAIRIALVLTGGGRYAKRGTVALPITAASTAIHLAGIKALPTLPGSMLRIEDEWVAYDDFRGGILTLSSPTSQRGARRTLAADHLARAPFWVGSPISIVAPIRR